MGILEGKGLTVSLKRLVYVGKVTCNQTERPKRKMGALHQSRIQSVRIAQ